MSTFRLIELAVGIMVSIILLCAPFVRRRHGLEHWAKLALIFAGLAGIIWGALTLTIMQMESDSQWFPIAGHLKFSAAGFSLGLILLLFASGQLTRLVAQRKSMEDSETPSPKL